MKKILIITNKFPFGKDETFLETELNFLLKSGLNVTIFSQNRSEDCRNVHPSVVVKSPESAPINLFVFLQFLPVLFSEFIRNFGNVFRFKVMVKTFVEAVAIYQNLKEITREMDAKREVVVYSYWHDNSTLAAIFLKRNCSNIRVVTRTHGADLYSERSKGNYLPFRMPTFRSIDQVFCISEHGKRYLQLKYPKFSMKFTRAYLGTRNSIEYQDLAMNPNSLMSCSHINPIKRLDLLIHALANLNMACRWEHFGYGYDYNEKPFFALVDELLPNSSIRYVFHGQIPNEQITERMSKGNYSFLINVSESEGLPVTMMESMSCGIPCIGTDVGGVSEIIRDGYNGFLLPSNPSIEEIQTVIYTCLNMSAKELNAMRKNAYETWMEMFNAESNYRAFAVKLSTLK